MDPFNEIVDIIAKHASMHLDQAEEHMDTSRRYKDDKKNTYLKKSIESSGKAVAITAILRELKERFSE